MSVDLEKLEKQYEVLGLPFSASIHDARQARRAFAKQLHPDKFHNNPKLGKQNEERLKLVNSACDILESAFANGQIHLFYSWIENKKANEREWQHANAEKEAERAEREREERRERAEREAKRAAKRKEKARTRELRKTFLKFQRLAKRGIAEAQYRLAILYRNGQGCVRDKIKAYRLFKKSAAGGDPRAMLYLGFGFALGIGVKFDASKAIALYEAAAKKEFAGAYFHLGFMHYFGIGVQQDFESAAKLYFQAIEHGYKNLDDAIDTCDHLRTETPKEYFKRYKWYVLSVKRAKI